MEINTKHSREELVRQNSTQQRENWQSSVWIQAEKCGCYHIFPRTNIFCSLKILSLQMSYTAVCVWGGSLVVESFLQKCMTKCVVSCPCFCCRGSVHGQLRPQHQRFSVLPHHSQDRLVRMCQEQFVPSVTSFVITGRVIACTARGTGVSNSILRMKRFEVQTPA